MTSTKTQKQLIGQKGEDLAILFLKKKGYEILEKNYRYKRCEIDIICFKKPFLVFVEVKTRKNKTFGYPEEYVLTNQMQCIQNAAINYMENSILPFSMVRYDIVSLILQQDTVKDILHLEDAF